MRYLHLMSALALVCLFNAGLSRAEEAETVETEPVAAAETSPAGDVQWSGFYAGMSIGRRTLEVDWKTTKVLDPDSLEIDTLSDPQASLESSETEPGLFIGYNWQFGDRWVLGAEILSQFYRHSTSIEDRIPGLSDPASDSPSFVLVNAENMDSFDPRLRGGFLIRPPLLLYATVSRTGLDVEATSVCPGDENICNPFLENPVSYTASGSVNATVIGLGVEYKLDRLQVRLEYLDADYGGFDFTAMPADFFLSFGADARLDLSAHSVLLGVSYGL